ncbi:MAG: hypothetical protein BWY74_04072 [Firmicutes bacterium ADurb.Bin419]|nr:MAG: hypothetical protein BWY74_04072 [Firmicutes bacterium ADurb.Bin419]
MLSWQDTAISLTNEMPMSYGIERNPFIKFVAQTKLNWPYYDIDRIVHTTKKIIKSKAVANIKEKELPVLSTLRNEKVLPYDTLIQLIHIKNLIIRNAQNTLDRDFLLLGWASIIEKVSGVRKDGRALRFVQKSNVLPVKENLKIQWDLMIEDLKIKQSFKVHYKPITAVEGDARKITESIQKINNALNDNYFDLIIFSPPYLNNFDYTEVYKMELWMLDKVRNAEEFRDLRLKTFRSHPSCKFAVSNYIQTKQNMANSRLLCKTLCEQIVNSKDKEKNRRIETIKGYFDDMYLSLLDQYHVLKPQGYSICVVANSTHGPIESPVPIATDLIITTIAKEIGFTVNKMYITRHFSRRKVHNEWTRESIIVLQK